MSGSRRQRRRAGGDGPASAAWSTHLAGLGEFAGRRERGREYLIAGAVREIAVECGRLSAQVAGSRVYHPRVAVQPLSEAVRAAFAEVACADGCSARALCRVALAEPRFGVLPRLRELTCVCTCPDRARPCKHAFAALYAFGRRLDDDPALLFTLRGLTLADLQPARARRSATRAGVTAR